ncbi:MAG: metallophosphoesterase [Flavobacteriales bacterium]
MTRIGLISDTHGYMDDRILHYFDEVDEIWHAGDIGSMDVLEKLEAHKPTRAVYGNIDDSKMRSATEHIHRIRIEGVDFFMIHIGGRPGKYYKGIPELLISERPKVFICGHSHICKVQQDKRYNLLYMNPGAAGIQGFHKMRTMLRFCVHDGKLSDMEVIELGIRGKT